MEADVLNVLLIQDAAGVEAITWDSACPDQTMPDVLLTWQLVNVLTMTGVEAIWIAVAV